MKTVRILTWWELRGGISIALSLNLCMYTQREIIIFARYIAMLFSKLVQALSIQKPVNHLFTAEECSAKPIQ